MPNPTSHLTTRPATRSLRAKLAVGATAFAVVAIASTLFPAAAGAAGERPNVKPGKWEITFSMEMPGMPAGAMQPTTMTQCYKAEDWKDSQSIAERMQQHKDRKCKQTDVTVTGDKMTWNMVCENGTTGTGEYHFSGNTYSGQVTINTAANGKHDAKTMTERFKGKRLGDC
jgi:hypothetical protein